MAHAKILAARLGWCRADGSMEPSEQRIIARALDAFASAVRAAATRECDATIAKMAPLYLAHLRWITDAECCCSGSSDGAFTECTGHKRLREEEKRYSSIPLAGAAHAQGGPDA